MEKIELRRDLNKMLKYEEAKKEKANIMLFKQSSDYDDYNYELSDELEAIYQKGQQIENQMEELESRMNRIDINYFNHLSPQPDFFSDIKPFEVLVTIILYFRQVGIPNGVIHKIIILYLDSLGVKISTYYRLKY